MFDLRKFVLCLFVILVLSYFALVSKTGFLITLVPAHCYFLLSLILAETFCGLCGLEWAWLFHVKCFNEPLVSLINL